MAKIWEFLRDNGFLLMLIGFLTAIVSVIALFVVQDNARYAGTIYPQLAFVGAITGFVIYIAGRILVQIQRRKRPPTGNDKL